MKAIIILVEGSLGSESIENNAITNMVNALLKAPGVTINPERLTTTILTDEDVMKCLVQHATTPKIEKPTESEIAFAKEMQLRAFCKDVLGTIGSDPLSDKAAYKRKFITWMLNDEKAYNSEIVQQLTQSLTRKQLAILREYNLQNIPAYLKLIQQL